MKGYKGFNEDLTCRGYQFEIGKEFNHEGELELCKGGFHFCKSIVDVTHYYEIQDEHIRLCEVEATGDVIEGDGKCVTNKIKIIREIDKEEMYELGNNGKYNTGFGNTGFGNTGFGNTGDRNTGFGNTGFGNTGDRNTGDWNKTNRSTGVFCNKEPKVIMFNKETDMTFEEWKNTRACNILLEVEKNTWINYEKMTTYEKRKHKSAKTCGGYFKKIPRKKAVKKWWKNLDVEDKQAIFNLPNFDLDIFNDIMESNITKKEYKEVMAYGND